MNHKKWNLLIFLVAALLILTAAPTAKASDGIPFVVLSAYEKTMDIHDEFILIAFTSTGKKATFKSSDSKVASVNTYGRILAKKAGSAIITAKIKNAEASLRVKVNKTQIELSQKSASIEHNETLKLTASTSNDSPVTFKSSKKSVASVDENGLVTGLKPGETQITASADKTSAVCHITVKQPSVKLSSSHISLFRGEKAALTATVSSHIRPIFKSNKKSVAIVDENGIITAMKHGTALVSAKVDGISKICEVTVKIPKITLEEEEIAMKTGTSQKLAFSVSSNNKPVFTSSNSEVVTVDSDGVMTALKKGTASITIKEDGAKVRCKVIVYK